EAAGFGKALPRKLEEHLAGCECCHAAFADEQALFRSIDGALQAATNTEIPASLLPRVRMQVALDSTKVNRRLPVLAFVTGGLVIGAIALSSSLRHSAVSHSTAKEPAAPSIQSAVSREPTGLSVETSSIQVSPTPGRLVARRERFILDRAAQGSEPEVLVSSEEEAGLRRYADLLRAKSFETSNRAAATDDAPFEIKPLEIAELGLRQLTIQPLEGSESD
ncbi:MAG TPA: hypothetical protein VF863_00135, partial [Candidatus Acidoferrum sp.]